MLQNQEPGKKNFLFQRMIYQRCGFQENINAMGVNDSMEFLTDKIKNSKNNSDFLKSMKS